MKEALDFWVSSYENGWIVRLAVVDKAVRRVIGTMELCLRVSKDAFDNMGILRVDVGSEFETEGCLAELFSLITPHMPVLLGCKGVITKAPIYAVERIGAIRQALSRWLAMKENIVLKLTAKDDNYACAYADKIISEVRKQMLGTNILTILPRCLIIQSPW